LKKYTPAVRISTPAVISSHSRATVFFFCGMFFASFSKKSGSGHLFYHEATEMETTPDPFFWLQ
jgi:hypothetical protein